MSEPGMRRQPLPAAHGDKKASGASSKLGEKQTEVAEQSPSADASKPKIMKPSETRSAPTTTAGSEKNTQSDKPADSQNKQLAEEKQKKPSNAKSQTSPSVTTPSKPNNAGKVTTTRADQPPQATSTETAKPESEGMSTVAGAAAAGTAGASVVTAADKSNTEPRMDESALDSLIDTLGGPEEDVPTTPLYTGPLVTEDDISSRYLEEMGKREGSLPPEYVKLLKSKGHGQDGIPPKANEQNDKPMTEDELAEALSSDFTCSTASAQEKKTSLTEKPSKEGEIVQAQAESSVKTSAPPEEKKKSSEEIKEDAVDALLDTLGGPELEPEEDHTPIVEVSEAKAKEKNEEKAGERDDTIPPEYRLRPELDKDGKPILPKPEEKPKPLSESDLVDEFSKDFACPAQPAAQSKPSKPSSESKKPSDSVSAKTTEEKVVPRVTACTVQSSASSALSSVGHIDEALEALSSSLGKREPDPDEKKPAVDKVKEKTKKKQHKKLGEDEETIPPEYRLTETKGKDGKPLSPKPEEKSQPMSENDLLEGLTEGFSCSPSPPAPLPTSTVQKKSKEGGKPAGSSDVISAATVSSVHSAAPLSATSGGKEMDEALDLLSVSLGQREPDPDENKPIVDKVKEKAKSEHRDKLGERDDTIPPDYLKLLESDDQSKPAKPTAKDDMKQKGQKKPRDDSAAIDALSGDFDTCAKAPATPQHSKDKSGKETTTTKPTSKDKGKPRDPKTAKGQSSSSKSEKQKTS